MSDTPTPAPRRGGAQRVFTVLRQEQLSPHLVRVHLGGDDFTAFIADTDLERLAKTDKYVKLMFAKPGLGLVPPYDLESLREKLPLEDLPARRTYTIRSIDHEAGSFAIDFVVHGDEGIAGPWAACAKPGDLISLSGPGGQFEPSTDATLPRLLLGDDSAVPAIAAALESMPADAKGLALIEVADAADEMELAHPVGIEVRWLHRNTAAGEAVHGTVLLEAARALPQPDVLPEVFAHGERGSMKSLRVLLHNEWGIDRRALSLSAYWALGRSEDGFQAEKRDPQGQIFEG